MVAAAPRAATNASAVMGRTSSRTVSTLAAKTITQAPVWAACSWLRPGGPAQRRRFGLASGQVNGERAQLGVGPGGGHLADPRVQFVAGQPALTERALEDLGHPRTIGLRRAKVAMVWCSRGGCGPVARTCHHRCLPTSAMQRE